MNVDLYRFEEECLLKNISYKLFDIGIEQQHISNNKKSIDLLTIHSSKGLEWDIVYLVHMNDDIFPSTKNKQNIVHERRLFYVAVTRARQELYFSYTSDERNLSRFIREIPNTMLLYHGIAKYMLSEFELGKSRKRLVDILGSLTTEDISKLRTEGYLDWFNTNKLVVSSLYPIDLYWKKPSWITNETLPDFQRFLNIWLKRHFCSLSNIPYKDPASEKLIFTLRIFTEDFEFWNANINKESIKTLVYTYFGRVPKGQDIPNVDYKMIEEYSINSEIFWSPKEIVSATSIMGKIRGQLRPLRFYDFDISDFTIGLSRFVVPIQWRGEILESWRRVVNTNKIHWKDCLIDLWKIGALGLVAEGRNAAMYRAQSMKRFLDNQEFQEFLESVERYTSIWFSEKNLIGTSIFIESENGIQESFDLKIENFKMPLSGSARNDLQTEKELYNIGGIRFDSSDLLRLAIGSSFLEESIENIGIFIPLDGKLFTLKLPSNIKEIANYILQMALSK